MFIFRYCLLVVVCLTFRTISFAADAENQPVRFYISEYPPFCFTENGQPKGLAVDVVQAMMTLLEEPLPIYSVPWKRGLYYLGSAEPSALFTVTRTPAREHLYKWVGPIAVSNLVFFAHKERPYRVENLDDAKQVKRIGTTQGYSAEAYLQAKGFTNLVSGGGSGMANATKLEKGYIDLWITADVVGRYMATLEGVDANNMTVAYTIAKQEKYLAFSQSVSDHAIEHWQAALDTLKENGTFDKIALKWGVTATVEK